MKKFILTIMIIMMSFIICSCDTSQNADETLKTLPDLTGLSRAQISSKLDELGIKYVFKFSDQIIESSLDLDVFVSYNGDYKAGDKIDASYQVYVYTTVLPLTHHVSDTVTMDFEYAGKSFIEDGVGEVILVSATDGDTARFKDPITGKTFPVRFLGIDTPESTIEKDPWGKAASNYTANKLYNAQTIVLEAEGARTESYDRYLAFVWVDGKLLNLQIVEQAYSNSTLINSKYEEYFIEASAFAKKTGRRFYGETDPGYDYETGRFK